MFQLPLLFPHKFKSLSDPWGASPFGQEGLTTLYIPWEPPRWAGLSHCSSLLWLRSSLTSSWLPAGESWSSAHCSSLFNCMLSSYNLCSISFTGEDELNLACHLRQATKCPLKIPSELWQYPAEPRAERGAGQVQHFKWGRICAQGNAVLNQSHPLDLYEKPRNPIA